MGAFQAAVDYGAGAGPSSVVVGDFDRDGKPDLAVANGLSHDVRRSSQRQQRHRLCL